MASVDPEIRSGGRVLAVIGILVVTALVIAIALSRNQARLEFEPGSPEAVVQSYLDHVLAGRFSEAGELMEDPGGCVSALSRSYHEDDLRAELVESNVSEDHARVVIRFEHQRLELFEGATNSWQEPFTLTRTSTGWRLLEPLWPVYRCSSFPGP